MKQVFKDAIRKIKLLYILMKLGFSIKQKDNVSYISKNGKTFLIKKGDFLGEYEQILTYIKLWSFLEERNNNISRCGEIKINENYGEIKIHGISLKFKLTGNIFIDLSTFLFYFQDIDLVKIKCMGGELFGYIKKRDIAKDDIVFDCGAYHGHFAIYAAKKATNGHIYCFEPDEINCRELEENIKLNDLKNITIIKKAISDKTGVIRFIATGKDDARVLKENEKICISNQIHDVESITLLDFCKENLIEKIDFIKMDIEGSECDVINSSKEFIKTGNCRNMAIASYHKINGVETRYELEKILKKLGLTCETDYPMHQTTYASVD
ncbi:MAG: FkbM family methyltransferase [Candidatus Micrarchaeia archaeon]